LTGKNYDYRKQWIQDRLEVLAGAMAVDIGGFAVMDNHLHVVVRTRPDIVQDWSDEEVARRWWRLFPKRRDENKQPAEPYDHELRMITADAEALVEKRKRLSSLSWFMRCLCEPIARRANKEDECSGRFFEGRFKCQKLLDEAAILACSVYVDLNPIRAGTAATPESSEHTSAYERIGGQQERQAESRARRTGKKPTPSGKKRRVGSSVYRDGWLCPVSVEGDSKAVARRNSHRRASNKGMLSMSLTDYLRILDWTGRQVRQDKGGAIPRDVAPILTRLGLSDDTWVDTVNNFGRWFHRAAGHGAGMNIAVGFGMAWAISG
jgi:hypothetical protein